MLAAERLQTIEQINVHAGENRGQRRRRRNDPRRNASRAIACAAGRNTRWLARSIMAFTWPTAVPTSAAALSPLARSPVPAEIRFFMEAQPKAHG